MGRSAPRNIYGVTKRAAEQLCRLPSTRNMGSPRSSSCAPRRFFPEEDDTAHRHRAAPGANTKANEFLDPPADRSRTPPRRMSPRWTRAPELGFDTFIISAMTPFSRQDRRELIVDAPSVVARYFPDYRALYDKRGWTMFASIDRVYDASRARDRLGFTCRTGFAEVPESSALTLAGPRASRPAHAHALPDRARPARS